MTPERIEQLVSYVCTDAEIYEMIIRKVLYAAAIEAIAHEREECARLSEEMQDSVRPADIAAAIRARKDEPILTVNRSPKDWEKWAGRTVELDDREAFIKKVQQAMNSVGENRT